MTLRVGDWVQVRTSQEILATLDARACLDGLPFMPQMLDYCGKRFRVSKRAHKLCDTVNGTGARRLADAVFLEEVRCDGCSFGGCQMQCRILWKEAWLEYLGNADAGSKVPSLPFDGSHERLRTLAVSNTRRQDGLMSDTVAYRCQATELPLATTPLSVWEPRQYIEDVRSGNARGREVASAVAFLVFDTIAGAGLGMGSLMRGAYELFQRVRGRWPYPSRPGRLPRDGRTPSLTLALRPGELVRVKTHDEILGTVTENLMNRGMAFHPEMVPYCGGTFRVGSTLNRIINEKTGQLLDLKNPCVVLEGATCVGRYTKPLLCPRGMPPYWRDIWLERVDRPGHASSAGQTAPAGGPPLETPCRR